jgi:hypothetical protein
MSESDDGQENKSLPAVNDNDCVSISSMSSFATADNYSVLDLTDEETVSNKPINIGDLVHRHAPRRLRSKNIGVITKINHDNAIVKIRLTNKIRKIPLKDLWLSVSAEQISDFFFNSEIKQQKFIKNIQNSYLELNNEFKYRNENDYRNLENINRLRGRLNEIEDTNEELRRELNFKDKNMSVEELMNQTIRTIRQEPEYINCRCQINAYREHNHGIKKEIKDRLIILDKKYCYITKIINGIQISIIVGSTTSAFCQASAKHIHLNERIIAFISLCLATYTSLLLAIAKYMKYDEKKETIHSLQQQFAEFLIQLETRDDQLNTWCSDSFWAGHDVEKKRSQWLKLEEQLEGGFKSLIDRKANLCCEFEKEMDSGSQKQTALYARRQELDIKLRKNKLLKFEIKAAAKSEELKHKLQDIETGNVNGENKTPILPPSPGNGYQENGILRSAPVIGNMTEPPK